MARQRRCATAKAKRGTSGREAHWREALGDWARSGLSKVAFCRERGLASSAFYWWKAELAGRDAARRSRSSRRSSPKPQEAKAKPAFVAVRVATGTVDGAATLSKASGAADRAVEVVLGNGRRVRVGAGFKGELLAQVVRVLEGMPW
jgi:hypothetical protein